MKRIITNLLTKRLTTQSTSDTWEPFGPWIPSTGVDECKALMLGKQNQGSAVTCQFAIRRAEARPENPTDWTALDTAQTSNPFERCTGEESLNSMLTDYAWFQPGVGYRLASGTYGQLDVSLQTSLVSRGMLVGEMPEMTLASAQQNTWQTPWTTRWLPAASVDKVSAGVWLAAITNTPEVRVAFQTATTRTAEPDAWAAAMPGGTASWTTTGDKNTGDVTPTLTGKMWVRLGIQVKSTDAPAAGDLDVVTVGAVVQIRRT